MNFSLLLKELREAITFRSLRSWFQRLLPLYFTASYVPVILILTAEQSGRSVCIQTRTLTRRPTCT